MSNCRTGEMREEFTMFANLARKDLRYVNYNLLLTELKSFWTLRLKLTISQILPLRMFRTSFSVFRNRHDQIGGDILDMLLSFTDFMAFKEMFLEYKSVSILCSSLSEKNHIDWILTKLRYPG